MNALKKLMLKINMQATIVALCILGVCVGTQQQQTAAWNVWIYDFSRDSLGVLMAVIILTNYKRSDFVKYKIPYIVWSVVSVLASIIIVPIAFDRRSDYLRADTVIIALGVFLMGYCVIHTFISFFVEKHRPKFYLPLLIIWIVMMVLMIFSRSDYLWPECYFVLFLCYYLTPQTPEQRKNVTAGLIDGIILGFILIQAHSLLCRPYDRIRYQGNFCNPNQNCMFLCMCLGAILAKILMVTKENRKKAIRLFYFLLAGVCCAFIFMTMSRSGYLAGCVAVVFFLIAYCRVKGRKIFIRMGVLLVSLFIFMLPVTYLAVRYIPTIHPHVMFYFQEGYSEHWVHSWDPWDSKKYITFEQMMNWIFKRFKNTKTDMDNMPSAGDSVEELKNIQIAANEDFFPLTIITGIQDGAADIETKPNKIPVLSQEESKNSLLVRKTIYEWYWKRLSLRGMPYDEQGFQLTKTHWIQDTHNIYLDYGINFGYPVMILFTVFIWWGIGWMLRQGLKKTDAEKLACLLIVVIPPIFGMFEFAWGAGMLSTVAFYMAFKEMFTVSQEDFSVR